MTTRDWASLCWLGVIIVWVLCRRDTRHSLLGVLRTAVHVKILIPVLIVLGWVLGLVLLGERASMWTPELLRDTIVWTLISALGLLLNVGESARTDRFFRTAVLRTLAYTVFVEFYVNLVTFNFWVELLLLIPAVTLVTLLALVSGTDEKTKQLKPLFDWLLAIFGFAVITHVTWRIVNGADVDVSTELRRLAMPVWLTIGILPVIFAVALLSNYELLFMRLGFATQDKAALRRARWAAVLGLRLHNRAVGRFGGPWLQRLVHADSLKDGRQVVKRYRADPESDDLDEPF